MNDESSATLLDAYCKMSPSIFICQIDDLVDSFAYLIDSSFIQRQQHEAEVNCCGSRTCFNRFDNTSQSS